MKQLKHFIFTAIIVAVLTAGIGFWLQNVLLSTPLALGASTQAGIISELLATHFWVIAFLFALIGGVMLYSIIAFRQKKGEDKDGDYIEGSIVLELAWTILPLGAVVWFAYLGGTSLQQLEAVRSDAMRVNVYGQQWAWSFEYPDYDITSDTLYLPVDEQVWLRMRSRDVIHSFWVPEFGPKQDLLPGGEIRDLRINPTLEGEYDLVCAELCGVDHSTMRSEVIVVSQADFDKWVQEKTASDPCAEGDAAGCGQQIASSNGCLACHSVDGTPSVGPTWQGLFGKDEGLADGTTVMVDADYLYESIVDPNALVVEGFSANIMPPSFGETLTDEQIQDIIAFISSLE